LNYRSHQRSAPLLPSERRALTGCRVPEGPNSNCVTFIGGSAQCEAETFETRVQLREKRAGTLPLGHMYGVVAKEHTNGRWPGLSSERTDLLQVVLPKAEEAQRKQIQVARNENAWCRGGESLDIGTWGKRSRNFTAKRRPFYFIGAFVATAAIMRSKSAIFCTTWQRARGQA
jgi:hypothetical protein